MLMENINNNNLGEFVLFPPWIQYNFYLNCRYKIFVIYLLHSHFLAATCYFTSFFTMDLGGAYYFIAWLFWIKFHFYIIACCKANLMPTLWRFAVFFFLIGSSLMIEIFNYTVSLAYKMTVYIANYLLN